MKCKKIFLGAIAALFLVGCTVSNTSIGGPDSINSSNSIFSSEVNDVPRYEGMVISRSHDTLEQNVLKKDPHKDHDNWGHNKDTIETDLTDLVDIDIQTDDRVKYYVRPNETFVIEVHLSNPQDYEIQSFTLNGKKYANYMFLEGSTMEILRLQTTAPSTSGYFDYTIDAIKYIDGTTIKDVDMSSGDKTIRAGISYETAPSANITSYDVGTTYINLGINIVDDLRLTKDNPILIYLSNGEEIVDHKELIVGANQVQFTGLMTSCMYQYGIVTAYDLIDGRDLHEEWLFTNVFKTLAAFNIKNVVAEKTSIQFDIERIEELAIISEISLYDAGTDEKVKSGDSSIRLFDELLSNHTYNIYVDYSYEVNNKLINDYASYNGAKTTAKVAPTIAINFISSDKTSINYVVSTEDIDTTLNVTKVELLKNGIVEKDNGPILNGSFSGLLSNNQYTIRAIYYYDLNDGQGLVQGSVSQSVNTEPKIAPTVAFDFCDADKTSIQYSITTQDVDDTLEIQNVQLIKDGEIIKTNNGNLTGRFDGILSNNEYVIKVSYKYNLNDGKEVVFDYVSYNISTLAKSAPTVQFDSCMADKTSITYMISYQDDENILNIQNVQLLRNGEIVEENDGLLSGQFDNLLSGNNYVVKILYMYDLNDGNGDVATSVSYSLNTDSNTIPTVSIFDLDITDCSANGRYRFDDPDSVGFIEGVELYKDGNLLSQNSNNEINFSNLEYFSNYELKVHFAYDLNDGAGISHSTKNLQFKTAPHVAMSSFKIINTSSVSEGETIYVQANLDNPLNALPISVIVNGKQYKCSNSSTTTKMFVEIINDGDFDGGETELVIEQIYLALDGKTYHINPTNNNRGSIFIYGRMELLDVSLATNDFEKKELPFVYESSSLYLYLSFMNKSNYTLESVTLLDSTIVPMEALNNNSNCIFDITSLLYWDGSIEINVVSFTYTTGGLKKTTEANRFLRIIRVKGDESIKISSPEELLQIDSEFNCYELVNDVDFNGQSLQSIPIFRGVLLGNNKHIKNISNIGTVINSNICFGLIKDVQESIISNIIVDDSTILMDAKSSSNSNRFKASVGFIAASSTHSQYFSCSVNENCTIEIKGDLETEGSYSSQYGTGGLVGGGDNCAYRGCVNNAYIYSLSDQVGGICGCNESSSKIIDCINNGRIEGKRTVGGIVGRANSRYDQDNMVVESCINNGIVKGVSEVGGCFGHISGRLSVSKCINNGNVIGERGAGGIVGLNWESTVDSCKNYGKISSRLDVAGGIVGIKYSGLIKNCYNSGNIESNNASGGIVGAFGNPDCTGLDGCVNEGYILSAGSAGGIIGTSYSILEYIKNCINYGKIQGNNICGGIGGGVSVNLFENCHNYGTIIPTSNNNYGNIYGRLYNEAEFISTDEN